MKIRMILFCVFFIPLGGCLLIGWGWSDYEESHTASPQPEVLELADLEAGKAVDNNHVRFGPHTAYYHQAIYTYSQDKNSKKEPDANTSISECYYPILSNTNPGTKKLEELKKANGSLDKVPETHPDLQANFVVIVKTDRYKKIGDIPFLPGIQTEPQLQGLILKHSKLGSEEKKLMQQSFPNMNFDKVIVLEDGRKPSTSLWCFTRVGLGLSTIVLGFGLAGLMTVMAIRGK